MEKMRDYGLFFFSHYNIKVTSALTHEYPTPLLSDQMTQNVTDVFMFSFELRATLNSRIHPHLALTLNHQVPHPCGFETGTDHMQGE